MKKITFGIIDTWPWGVKNAESEVINRIKIAAKNIDANLKCITKEGFIVNDDFQKTDKQINEQDLDFVISMHYEDMKMLDIFHYHTLWNPPKITLQYPLYHLYVKNIISHDDYLLYDDGGMGDHLKTMLSDSPRDLAEASSLTASFSKTAIITPQISENPVLFYCGMNWERFIGAEARHSGLFSLLDEQKDVNLYGPEHSWDGYKRYQGLIPFDGTSLIEEINKCGVVLALSSDYHYRAGAATNRIYEACAGGAITISDTNRFIMKNFGNSVLYIDYNKKNPEKMFLQIRNHLNWIKNHPNEALEMAKKAQQIFIEKFSLEKQLSDIISNHEKRKNVVRRTLYAQHVENVILAILFLDTDRFGANEKEIINNAIHNIKKQKNANITLAICCDNHIKNDVLKFKQIDTNINVVGIDFFDDFSNKLKARGEAFAEVVKSYPHKYIIILDGSETMFSTHITTLSKTLENNPDAIGSYSGNFLVTPDRMRYPQLREAIHKSDIYNCHYPHISGMFLFRSEIEKFLPKEAEQYLDECLPNALVNLAIFNYHRKIKYSHLMTIGKIQSIDIDFPKVMTTYQETNFIQGLVQSMYEEWLATIPDMPSNSSINEVNIPILELCIFFLKIKKFFAFKNKQKYRKQIKKLKQAIKSLKQ